MNLQGKKLLITGVINRESIAYEVAKQAQEAGAEIVLTGFGRAKRMTDRSAAKLDPVPDVLELDVNKPEDIEAVADDLRERWGRVDGILHAIAFAPERRARRQLPQHAAGERDHRVPDVGVLAEGAGRRAVRPVPGGGRVDRRARLRRHRRLAGLRLDGRGQGGAGGHLALPGARPRPAWRAREPGVRRPARHARRARHPRLRRSRRRVAAPGAAAAGTSRIRRRSRRRSTSCSATPRARSRPRSSTSTAASTRWAPRSRRWPRRSRREAARLLDRAPPASSAWRSWRGCSRRATARWSRSSGRRTPPPRRSGSRASWPSCGATRRRMPAAPGRSPAT